MSGADLLMQAPAIRRDAENVQANTLAALAQSITRAVAVGRKSMKAEAEKVANAVINGEVETLDWQHTKLDLLSSGSYKALETDASLHIYPWESGTNSNQAPAGQWDIIQWAGFAVNHTIQAATLAELYELGKVRLHWGDSNEPSRDVPLQNFLYSRIDVDNAQGALASGAAPLVTHVNPLRIGTGFYFDAHKPLIVIPSDSKPKLVIRGLSGTAAGSSPALTLQFGFKGLRVRL